LFSLLFRRKTRNQRQNDKRTIAKDDTWLFPKYRCKNKQVLDRGPMSLFLCLRRIARWTSQRKATQAHRVGDLQYPEKQLEETNNCQAHLCAIIFLVEDRRSPRRCGLRVARTQHRAEDSLGTLLPAQETATKFCELASHHCSRAWACTLDKDVETGHHG